MEIVLGRREVASTLFKHLKLLVGVFFIGFLLFFGASFLLTSKYKATSQILVQSGREYEVATEKGNAAPAGVPYVTKQEIINSEVEILTSGELADKVIKAVGLNRIYPSVANDGDPADEQMADARKRFSKDFKAEPVVMSNVVTLSLWNPDRDVAIQTLRTLTEIYEQRHAQIFGNKSSGVLGRQTSEYEKRLVEVTDKITGLKNSQHLSDINYEREQLIQDRADVESKLRDLKAQSIEAHRQLEFYRRQLQSMPELVLTNENSADAVETAKARLLDLNTQLLQLNQRYAPDTPDAVGPREDLVRQIAEIKAFINDPSVNEQRALGRNITFDDARLKLQTAEATVPASDEKIQFETAEDQKILARLQALDDGEASLEVLTREQDTLRELVHDYRDRYEEARSAGDLDKQNLISVSVLGDPQSELKPDKPKRLLFAAIGFVAGLMLMGLTIIYLVIFRESIITTESLERTLGLRVLCAVPDTA